MDCEKCEELMLDELYGELDDVTSAMVRRHVQSCSRCNGMLADLRGTREAVSAALVQEEAPASLEERIFAAEKEARKVVPIRSRTSTFISIAGRWAMRPQTAMAALFLLMIGSTTFLLKGRPHGAQSSASAPITVAQEGAPVAAPNEAQQDTLGPNAARNAHGPLETAYATPPPAAAPTAAASAATGTIALADDAPQDLAKKDKGADGLDPNMQQPAPKAMARAGAPRPTTAPDMDEEDRKLAIGNAGMPGGAPAAPPPPPAANAAGPSQVVAGAAGGGTGSGGAMAQQSAAESANGYAGKQGGRSAAGDDFAQGMTAYQGRQYTPAMQSFDRASQGGDLNASLWAARSVRDGQGCNAALGRFDSVSQRGGSSSVGADATLEGAQCYAQVGSIDVARAKYTQLLGVPSHAARAQAGLDSLNAVAARKAPARAKAAAPQTPPQAAPPAQPAKPSATDNSGNANQNNGF